jgi:hypothetical protein
MKRIFFISLGLLLSTLIYLCYEEFSFTPIKEAEFKNIFKGHNINFSKLCSKDFIGLSLHGELFEIYLYKVYGAVINNNLPDIDKWENKKITKNTHVSKWNVCPPDYKTQNICGFLTVSNYDNTNCSKLFISNLYNIKNYYSYIDFDGAEQYFLLYCSDSHELFYIRKRGL